MITDKMPQNFRWIPFIAAALPEAKIIHVHRDPRAVCWSNYKQNFSGSGLGYTCDLGDTVRYHGLYRKFMTDIRPRYMGRILDVDYERLTEDPENLIRRLIDHLGLPWQDACLNFHKNRRSVRTASQQQVRKKIYKGSSEEWRRFEPFLDGALDALKGPR